MLLTDHVFEKLRSIDLSLAEFELMVGRGEVVERVDVAEGVKELILLLEWVRPLHVVEVRDLVRDEIRILTVYEPEPEEWSANFKIRRR